MFLDIKILDSVIARSLEPTFTSVNVETLVPLIERRDSRAMDRSGRWTTVRHLLIGGAIGLMAAILLVIESVRRESSNAPARAPLWPRPDGSIRSFGEVWDIPGDRPRAT